MNWFEGKTIVVPIDFSEQSRSAVDTALGIVFRPSDIHVIYVAPDLTATAPEVVWQDVTEDTRRSNIKTSFERDFADDKYRNISFHVAFGDPGREISEYAQEIGAGAIVMPSHGRTGLKRLLLGSVAERILRLSHCPVLVLKD